MFNTQPTTFKDKASLYTFLNHELKKLIASESDALANLSNASALLNIYITNINWVGFYILRGDELVLGPFQGKPACVHIPIGSGVCGTAALNAESLVVPDVHQFPGHIACDSASNSEIVVPIFEKQKVVAVIDIDSPEFNTFDEEDRKGLEAFSKILSQYITFTNI